ncbi:hypothetical protein [Pseudogemmobacter bohemicus]|uniref:hypothetical protein n=1 Tax=Pseudogemmobacter bohemicus TaxID=2250708 RepID=UPI001300B06B|nr:hypothetical protein [Pseudogemmobacter bohemicus]
MIGYILFIAIGVSAVGLIKSQHNTISELRDKVEQIEETRAAEVDHFSRELIRLEDLKNKELSLEKSNVEAYEDVSGRDCLFAVSRLFRVDQIK